MKSKRNQIVHVPHKNTLLSCCHLTYAGIEAFQSLNYVLLADNYSLEELTFTPTFTRFQAFSKNMFID